MRTRQGIIAVAIILCVCCSLEAVARAFHCRWRYLFRKQIFRAIFRWFCCYPWYLCIFRIGLSISLSAVLGLVRDADKSVLLAKVLKFVEDTLPNVSASSSKIFSLFLKTACSWSQMSRVLVAWGPPIAFNWDLRRRIAAGAACDAKESFRINRGLYGLENPYG